MLNREYHNFFDVNNLSYEWSNNDNKPIPIQTYLNVVFYCKNGLYINIVTKDKQYSNYADCAKNGLSNMKLVDFGDNEMNINIIGINTIDKIEVNLFLFLNSYGSSHFFVIVKYII